MFSCVSDVFKVKEMAFCDSALQKTTGYITTSQRQSEPAKEWPHSSSPRRKKFRKTPSTGKLMPALFRGCKAQSWNIYMSRGTSSGVLFERDDTRPREAQATAQQITNLRWECIPHRVYSPDLAPSSRR